MTFFDFWGKTRRGEKEGGDDYHLLCWHSLDVAAMGYLMVKSNCFGLADYFRQLGFADTEQAAQFFTLVVVQARYWKICPLISATLPAPTTQGSGRRKKELRKDLSFNAGLLVVASLFKRMRRVASFIFTLSAQAQTGNRYVDARNYRASWSAS